MVDDGGFPTVVQTKTQHIHLLLQPQPSCQLVKQPHWLDSNHQLLVIPIKKRLLIQKLIAALARDASDLLAVFMGPATCF